MKKVLIFIFAALSATQALASTGDDFSKMTPHDALAYANSLYHKDKGSIQVFPDKIVGRFEDGSRGTVELKDEFLVSIAPYVNRTHPCDFHVATSCTGELKNKELVVNVYDADTQSDLLYKKIKTNPNGFIDLWLPRNHKKIVIRITDGNKHVKRIINTTEQSPTCITNAKLV